jgi:hypothetical protein
MAPPIGGSMGELTPLHEVYIFNARNYRLRSNAHQVAKKKVTGRSIIAIEVHINFRATSLFFFSLDFDISNSIDKVSLP